MTCWCGTRYPELFAGLSPWNSPTTGYVDYFKETGLEMPFFGIVGDNDHKPSLIFNKVEEIYKYMLEANHCSLGKGEKVFAIDYKYDAVRDGNNYYTQEQGYTEPDRLRTYLFQDDQGIYTVAFTLMKNMPHGAIYDESRAAWDFLKHFKRLPGGEIVYSG